MASHSPSSLMQGLNLLLHWPHHVQNVITFWWLTSIWNRIGSCSLAQDLHHALGALPGCWSTTLVLVQLQTLNCLGPFLGFSRINFCWYLSQQRAFDWVRKFVLNENQILTPEQNKMQLITRDWVCFPHLWICLVSSMCWVQQLQQGFLMLC